MQGCVGACMLEDLDTCVGYRHKHAVYTCVHEFANV